MKKLFGFLIIVLSVLLISANSQDSVDADPGVEWLIEYDITKVDLKNEYVKALLKLIEDARTEDAINVTQFTPHKAHVKISKTIIDEFNESIKDGISIGINTLENDVKIQPIK